MDKKDKVNKIKKIYTDTVEQISALEGEEKKIIDSFIKEKEGEAIEKIRNEIINTD